MATQTALEPRMTGTLDDSRARAATWMTLSVRERCVRLSKLRQLLAEDAPALADCITAEIGKPLQESFGADILPSLSALDWLVKTAPKHLRERRVKRGKIGALPYGVVGVIGTWNYPVYLNLTPIAWALAAGNAVIYKPSEHAPETAKRLEALFQLAELPVTVIYGGGEVGQELCQVGVDKLVFTGGGNTGRAILKTLAEMGTPSVMELSGNDAMLVLSDANVTLAARSAVWGRCCNAGQSCVAPGRIYVATEIYEQFLGACLDEIVTLRPDLEIIPMKTEALRNRAHELVLASVAQGAKPLTGKNVSAEMGRFYPPTLLSDCDETMPVMSEDFFGPVLAVCPIETDSEAIVRANSGEMALAASVWTNNRARGEWVARQLRVGLVSINEILLDAAAPEIPFGGMKASGFGKQRGIAGLEEFVVWKTVTYRSKKKLRRHLFPYEASTPEILAALIALQSAKRPKDKLAAVRAITRAALKK